jgi:hypothetical protein
MKCISCEEGSKPDDSQSKCAKSMFHVFFSKNNNYNFKIPMNGLGGTCTVGTDCPVDQVCDNKKCVDCEQGVTKPNENQDKCIPIPSMLYIFFSTTIKDNFNL